MCTLTMRPTSSMTSTLGVNSQDDVWKGTSDPKVRRRLQNRVNQRLSSEDPAQILNLQ